MHEIVEKLQVLLDTAEDFDDLFNGIQDIQDFIEPVYDMGDPV